jgi:hypothetical protein
MVAFQVVIRVAICAGVVIATQCQLAGLAIVRTTSGAAARLRAESMFIIPSLECLTTLYALPIHDLSIAQCYTFVKRFDGELYGIYQVLGAGALHSGLLANYGHITELH